MTIEREIELLKEKVALLEKIKELEDIIASSRWQIIPYQVPYIPYVPNPYPTWQPYTTSGTTSEGSVD